MTDELEHEYRTSSGRSVSHSNVLWLLYGTVWVRSYLSAVLAVEQGKAYRIPSPSDDLRNHVGSVASAHAHKMPLAIGINIFFKA